MSAAFPVALPATHAALAIREVPRQPTSAAGFAGVSRDARKHVAHADAEGPLIILNGAARSGKSSVVVAIQNRCDQDAYASPRGILPDCAQQASGFIYCVSLVGISGARRDLSNEVEGLVHRRFTDPVTGPRNKMVQVYYDEHADIRAIADETIAVIGYGIQGSAQAQNLRDSGLRVIVGNRDDDYRQKAIADGFAVHAIADAVEQGDIILLLIPDELQADIYNESVKNQLRAGQALVFAHGFAVHYGLITPPNEIDVMLLAPRMPGRYVREKFLAHYGVPVFVCAHQDTTGRALERVLALAKANGFTRAAAMQVSFADETELDHFSEHYTYPLIFRSMQIAFEVLVEAGYEPEVALMELYGSGEIGEVLIEAARIGLWPMLKTHGSPAAQFGVYYYNERVVPESNKQLIREILDEVKDGRFARELVHEQRQGYPRLRRATAEALASSLTEADKRLQAIIRKGSDTTHH